MAEETEKNQLYRQTTNCENVTQQLQVEKQEFKCIINFNTKVCTKNGQEKKKFGQQHKPKHSGRDRNKEKGKNEEENKNRESTKKKCKHIKNNKHRSIDHLPNLNAIERTVPCCFRKTCWDYRERRNEIVRRHDIHLNLHSKWVEKSLTKDEVKYKQNKPKHHHHHDKNKHSKQKKQTESRMLLSPISSLSLEDMQDNQMLEDISDTSLDVYVKEKPKTYKRHITVVQNESKLDTLIKRAKERERKLVEQSRQDRKSWVTSTPIRKDYSSADFPMDGSDSDISFNSLSTVVLESHHSAYSPTSSIKDLQIPIDLQNPANDLSNSNVDLQNPRDVLQSPISVCSTVDLQNLNKEKTLKKLSYSPSSPQDYTTKMAKESNDKLLKVKNEPTMDIYGYSRVSTPKINSPAVGLKRDFLLKSEPFFACASHIYFENKEDNTALSFCKIDNVKSEFIDL